jgi:hypothetical protein
MERPPVDGELVSAAISLGKKIALRVVCLHDMPNFVDHVLKEKSVRRQRISQYAHPFRFFPQHPLL